MSNETFLMQVTRYRDESGNPTCATDFNAGKVCQFYATQRFGCEETCLFANKEWRYWTTLFRRDSGKGSLIPLEDCPMWKHDESMQKAQEHLAGAEQCRTA